MFTNEEFYENEGQRDFLEIKFILLNTPPFPR